MTGGEVPAGRGEEERRRKGGRAAPPDAWGVVPAYEDAFGNWTQVPDATRQALVEAMGGDPSADGPPEVDAVLVVRRGDGTRVDGAVEVVTEGGETVPLDDGRIPDDLPHGYHDLRVRGEEEPRRLIVSPGTCWLPEDLRIWGWAAQLYAARSGDSWGMGDLADLRRLARWSRSRGAGTILLNPLDAVSPTPPRETSPYFPTSRRWLDPIYLRIEEVPGASAVAEALAPIAERGRALSQERTIDRDAVYAAKLAALETIWDRVDGAGHEPGFDRFAARHGDALRRFATYEVLAETFGTGWRSWPDRYRRPDAEHVARFAREHAERVRFRMWLQWCTAEQLRQAGEELPLLADVPIGADPDGADAWELQDLLADGVTVGAPPDELGPEGQDWSLPAFVPWKLRAARYEPFVETLRAAFQGAGGLRIDHVLGLFRMFWIPPDGTAADGTYVRQPTSDLLDILALESQRAEAFVVGEDLGTVEEGVRPELARRRILRYQVLWFEDDPVDDWTVDALASVSTHDLPTVAGVWTRHDLDMQRRIGLEPDEAWFAELRDEVVRRTGVDPDADAAEATVALHAELARAPNRIVVAQLEDALAEPERPNVPGTDRSVRPNWSLALPVPLEELERHPTVAAVADALDAGR